MSFMNHSSERWERVAHARMYEVSSLGRIRSWKRHRGQDGPRLIAPVVNDRGYAHVRLEGHSEAVHRLVARAFLGERPDGLEVCHNDGDKLNNRAENLRYDTHESNMRDIPMHAAEKAGRK